ncbi:hypothetical protein KIW84_071639 [Lathyrus oleraceus]|uniref:Uncharacterized protein n=1 Tax=Pisum sativum TaxID=3888 RepID=A0A9D4VJA3_PEA|nr:hypothetical protein KIW84_071639 [Pisum sativum]
MEASKKWKLTSFHQVDIDTDEISHLDVDTLIGHGGNIKVSRDGSGCEATRERKIYQVALKKNGMTVAVKQLDQGDGYIAPGK